MQGTSDCQHAERNYGIDLLRLVSMYMVVILHVLAESGVLSAQSLGTQRAAWLLETAAYSVVNCFGMISGYVSYRKTEKPYRYSRFLSFWVPVFFYSFGITLLAHLLKPGSVGNEELLLSAIPVTSGVYWYVSAYAGLFFLIPWLNAFLRTIDNKKCSKFIFIVFAVFICYGNLSRHFNDGFYLNDGYSLIWLVFLYLIGAWMKKCDIPSRVNQKHLILGFVVSTVFSWFMKEFAGAQVFVNYISLTIVYNAFALVCVFSKMKMNSTEVKVISALAPAAFEVYLIHSQTVIWDHFMTDAFTWIAGSSIWLVPFEVLGSALGIFLVCLLIKKNTAGCLSKNWNQQSDPESRRKNGSVYSEDMEQIQNSHSLTTESRTTEGNKTQMPRRRLLSRSAFALRFCSTSAAVST